MALDPGFIDVLGEEEAVEEQPFPQEYDYLWTEERNSLQEENGIWDPSLWFQGASDRQGVAATNPLAVALVVGICYSGLLLANSLLNPPEKPKLQNDDRCGITGGGQAECWWDCMIISGPSLAGQAIANPECLKDCFSDTSGGRSDPDSVCFAKLIEDVTSKGTCDTGRNPAAGFNEQGVNVWGWNDLDNSCTMTETDSDGSGRQDTDDGSGSGSGDFSGDFSGDEFAPLGPAMDITRGTCSDNTEKLLSTTACMTSLEKQPNIVRRTLELLVRYACTTELYQSLPFSKEQLGRKMEKARLAPISEVDEETETRTELNYENTRHRYPWICSLRTRGVNSEHLCAVNLLAVPPNPTVIVGSAHCTYLCKDKDNNGVTLPACCCVTKDKGQETCKDDTVKCGTDPKAVEMDGSDAEIICGEWQTGSTSQSASGEKYNVVLPIVDIVQSPAFDANGLGPGGGGDIAVFKVNDAGLQNSRKLKIYPACLPPKDRSHPTEGVHSGWSKPPPLNFIERFAKGFLPYYSDFFKQWHYKMKIQESCADPTKTQAFGLDVKYPSNTSYPPATVCALDVTAQSCFSTGDSGSPLMVREEKRPQRFYIEGILSFVKGCEQIVFGARNEARTKFIMEQLSENPAAYAKLSCYLPWIAEQYGLSYDVIPDESCSKGTGPKVPFNSTHEYDAVCRNTLGTDLTGREHPCIFPFYYRGKGPYDRCMLFEEEGFVYPVFRCPTRNITTKFPGTNINHFEETLELTKGYCFNIDLAIATCDFTIDESGGPDCQRELDPSQSCTRDLLVPPFSTCKNDCPGGERPLLFLTYYD